MSNLTKAQLEEQLAAAQSRLAELEAGSEPAPAVVGTERVTYRSKRRKHQIRFPFRPQQTVLSPIPGGMKTHVVRHPNATAQFIPDGAVGIYTTTDPEEIAFLDKLADPLSPKKNRHVSVLKREPLDSAPTE